MSRKFILRTILLTYLVLVSYAIIRSFQTGSTSGLILSILSLAAGVHFFYLLNQYRKQLAESDPAQEESR